MKKWFIWNVLFRAHEMAKGHDTYAMLRDMEAAELLPSPALEELRCRKLQDLVAYAYAHVPFHRDRMKAAGVTPTQIARPADLALLPLMRKADVRANRQAMRSDIAGKLASFTTGGSTGEPLIFDLAKRRVASRVACRQRTSRWWGVSTGDRELAIWGAPVELSRQDRVRGLRDRFLASRLLSAFEMNEATVSRYLDVLEEGGWRQLFGYPSAIYLVCLQARREGRNLRGLGLKVVFVTGEVLLPYQREVIVETLNCPVANGYGGRDTALIAHECPQGGMHVLADAVIVELLAPDGRPAPPGEPGEIVVTDLYSHEAPFIRYATGDVAVLSGSPCNCGRVLPVLERVEGRSNDSIVAPDGRIINSLALIYPVRELEGIDRFRICQNALDDFAVQIVRTARYPADAEDRIRHAWSRLLRTPVKVSFEYPAELPVERSGKFRHIVSRIPAGQSAAPAAAPRDSAR
jgi:phenylacetate-coenzyme A ligase PaaK-like adenylate-forming protein